MGAYVRRCARAQLRTSVLTCIDVFAYGSVFGVRSNVRVYRCTFVLRVVSVLYVCSCIGVCTPALRMFPAPMRYLLVRRQYQSLLAMGDPSTNVPRLSLQHLLNIRLFFAI